MVAELIHVSTNAWYQANLNRSIFQQDDASGCLVFPEVYEALDPGCCLVTEEEGGRLMGSCFYHPRETHVSRGIMNVHPDFAGLGVAIPDTLQAHRIAHWLWHRDRRTLAQFFQNQISVTLGVDMHPAARIGSGLMLDHFLANRPLPHAWYLMAVGQP